jgi:hypothetical protein
VPGKEYRQIEDHADHGRGNAGQGRGEAQLAPRRLDRRRAGEDEEERRQEGEEGRGRRAGKACAERIREPPCATPPR